MSYQSVNVPQGMRIKILHWLEHASQQEFGSRIAVRGIEPTTMVNYISAVRFGLPQYAHLKIVNMVDEIWIVKEPGDKL